MKKLLILLGLIETATEAQAITAVNSLKKDAETAKQLASDAQKELADKTAKIGVLESAMNDANTQLVVAQKQIEEANKALENVKQDVETSFEQAVADKTKELQERVAELEFQLTDAINVDIKTTAELKGIAKQMMAEHKLTHLYMVTDGTPFYKEEDAITHARKVGGKHYMYGDKPQEQE